MYDGRHRRLPENRRIGGLHDQADRASLENNLVQKLLARWHRDDSVATIFLGPAPHAEESVWEGFEGFEPDFDSPATSCGSSRSWSDGEDQGSEDHGSDNGDDGNNGSVNIEPDCEKPEDGDESGGDSQETRDADDSADNGAGDKDGADDTGTDDPRSDHASSYFNFCGLPRELRDLIYDQFQRLHPDTPRFREAGWPELMMSQPVTTKPITPLLLVNKMIGSEYKDACKERLGVIVSRYIQ